MALPYHVYLVPNLIPHLFHPYHQRALFTMIVKNHLSFTLPPPLLLTKLFVNSLARLSEHKVVRQLEPLYGQNLASGGTLSQGSTAPEQAQAGGEAGPSSPNNSAGEWEIRPSSTSNIPHVSRSQRSSPVEQPGWCHDVLIPVRRYEGFVDVSIIPCIGRFNDDDHYDPRTSKYHVIGLTDDVAIIMETRDIDIVLDLLKIPLHRPLHNVTSPEEQILIKL
jgi:hypothetical protein